MRNIKLADRLTYFDEYIFSNLEKKVKDVERNSNRKVLNFSIGNPDISPNKKYIDKLEKLIKEKNAHLYPGYGANSNFSNSLISWYKKRFNVDIKKGELFPLLGAKDGISHLPLVLLNEGDEVLVPDPGYPAFSGSIKMIKGKVVYYDLVEENEFKISIKQLEEKISSKTKFIWINFPSNPTGQVMTLEELEEIVLFAKNNNIFILYDNAYSEITFGGYIAPSILQVTGAKDIAVEIGSFSKTFSFAGFRMGWVVGNSFIIKAFSKLKSQMDSGISTSLQNLGAFALDNFDENWYEKMISSYYNRRQIIGEYFKKIGLRFKPSLGSLYIWAKIPDVEKNSEEFCERLLKEKQILVTPGTAFGKNGKRFVRISISTNIDKISEYF